MAHISYRASSRADWGMDNSVLGNSMTDERVQLGAILRIADATEKMAGNYTALQNDLKWEQERNERYLEDIKVLNRKVAAYKGIVKKLKMVGKK